MNASRASMVALDKIGPLCSVKPAPGVTVKSSHLFFVMVTNPCPAVVLNLCKMTCIRQPSA